LANIRALSGAKVGPITKAFFSQQTGYAGVPDTLKIVVAVTGNPERIPH
jgi:hypothetical protein